MRSPFAPPRVLIVEDEALVARDLERSLDGLGYSVLGCAATCDEALAIASKNTPDIALLDVRIRGDRDGIETGALLRDRFGVPVIYLTAYADDETVARAAATQPYGYIVKPFTSREVRSAIEIARHKFEMDTRLAAEERWLQTTLRSIGDAVIACGPDQRVRLMNPVAEQLTGLGSEEAVGRKIDDVLRLKSLGEHKSLHELLAKALREQTTQYLPEGARIELKNGLSERRIASSAAPIIHDGMPLGSVLVLRDVTEQRELQERIALSDRLASLGTLAAGMCHEINNPLTFIIANITFIEEAIEGWKRELPALGSFDLADRTLRADESLEDLREGAERIRRIVADLSVFGRGGDEMREQIDVRHSVRWAIRVAASQVRSRAQLIERLEPVPDVIGSRTRLTQVVINLLINAAHSIREGEPERNAVSISTSGDAEGRVIITVEDTGSGIDPKALPHIFDPFFTTKDAGVGAGLGLSICHGLVKSLGGDIRVQSQPGVGSRFEVSLPGAFPARVKTEEPPPNLEAARGRILLIDDEPSYLRLVKALLDPYHEVETATDGIDAIELLDRGERFDLMLCDVTMPRLDGPGLYERACAIDPALAKHFVFVTGGAFTPRTIDFLKLVDNPQIQKPFDPPDLLDKVQEWLRAIGAGNASGR